MRMNRWLLLSVLGIGVAVAATTLVMARAGDGTKSVAANYPDAPFKPVGKDYPRIIPVRDWPETQDRAVLDQFRKERKAVKDYLLKGGAMRNASAKEREAVELALYTEQ